MANLGSHCGGGAGAPGFGGAGAQGFGGAGTPGAEIALVICSVKPEMAAAAVAAARATAGVAVEAVIVDNRERGWSIARAYNWGASQATAPRLIFMHEDVTLMGDGWGQRLTALLDEPQTGVVGPAGSTVWVPSPSSWWEDGRYVATAVTQLERHHGEDRWVTLPRGPLPEGGAIPAVTLDGLLLAVRRDLWQAHPFDEQAITGFHGYDIDFTTAIAAAGHHNHVMDFGPLRHASPGNYTAPWAEAIMRLWQSKWRHLSPIVSPTIRQDAAASLSLTELKAIGQKGAYNTIFKTLGLRGHRELKKAMWEAYTDYSRTLRATYPDTPHPSRHLSTLLWRRLTHP